MVIFWMFSNFIYMTGIVAYNNKILARIGGPEWTFVEAFAAFMGGMVVFKTTFGCLHILKMKAIYMFKIRIPNVDLRKEGRKNKKQAHEGELAAESDEDYRRPSINIMKIGID